VPYQLVDFPLKSEEQEGILSVPYQLVDFPLKSEFCTVALLDFGFQLFPISATMD
jgi:hypothetical protein